MNAYPRNSRYLNHLISALPSRCICAEDGAVLIYACGVDTETLTCSRHPEHTGLAEIAEWHARDVNDNSQQMTGLAEVLSASWLDESIRQAYRLKQNAGYAALFGDEND